jgi:hypothetical protein
VVLVASVASVASVGEVEASRGTTTTEWPAEASSSRLPAHHAEKDLRVDAACHATSASEHVRHVHEIVAAVITSSFPYLL